MVIRIEAQILDDKWNPTDATLTVQKNGKWEMSAAPWVQNWREDMQKNLLKDPLF